MSTKSKEPLQPCCLECLAIVPIREGMIAKNHRDQTGNPCPGSRQPVKWIHRNKPKKARDK